MKFNIYSHFDPPYWNRNNLFIDLFSVQIRNQYLQNFSDGKKYNENMKFLRSLFLLSYYLFDTVCIFIIYVYKCKLDFQYNLVKKIFLNILTIFGKYCIRHILCENNKTDTIFQQY